MNPRRLRALIIKESLQVIRDPSSILVAFILPLILLFLMGYALSLDVKKIPLAIITNSNSEAAQKLVASFTHSKFFKVSIGQISKPYVTMMEDGTIRALIHIDAEFGKNAQYNIQVISDGSEPTIAGMTQKYCYGIIQLWAKESIPRPMNTISVESHYWFNPPLSSRYFLLPGSIAVVMTLIGTLLTALVVAREWERGTMEALMATPTSMIELIIGKLFPYFILGMGSMLLCFFVAYFWYEIPFLGSFWMLLVLSATYLLTALSIGLLISTIAKNQFVAAQASILIGFLPAFLLSGFLFEIQNMPVWLQTLTYIFPARYFVESLQTLFLVGNIYEIFLFDIAVMAAISVLLLLLIVQKSKKEL